MIFSSPDAKPVARFMRCLTVNPYMDCDFACSFCVTRAQGKSQLIASPEETWRQVEDALAADGAAREYWVVGSFVDPYLSAEEETRVTRGVVERLVRADAAFMVITKSPLVLRDVDLLQKASRGTVVISLLALNSEQAVRMEGNAPAAADRIETIKRLQTLGITCEVNLAPFVPGVTDLPELLEAIPDDIKINIQALNFGRDRNEARFGGRRFVRSEVWDGYLEAYERYGHIARLSWILPSLGPSGENGEGNLPLLAEPLASPSPLRRERVALALEHERAAESGPGQATSDVR